MSILSSSRTSDESCQNRVSVNKLTIKSHSLPGLLSKSPSFVTPQCVEGELGFQPVCSRMTSPKGILKPISKSQIINDEGSEGVHNSDPYVTASVCSTRNIQHDSGVGEQGSQNDVTTAKSHKKMDCNILETPSVSCEGIETHTNSVSEKPSVRSVKVKPMDVLQSKDITGERQNQEFVRVSKTNTTAETLESAVQRLESISSQLASLVDSYDHFGKYISSVLRSLPIEKVHSLKQKIISDVMEALAQEDTVRSKHGPQHKDLNVQPNFSAATNQTTVANHPNFPNSFGPQLPIHGNIPRVTTTNVPQSFFEAKSSDACQMADGHGLEDAASPVVAASTIKTVSTAAIANEPSTSQTSRGQKRRKTSVNSTNKKIVSSCETTTHSVTTSDDESSRDMLLNAETSQESEEDENEQDMEIISKEENVLGEQIKEDPFVFETVICDEGPSIYLKEEALEPEDSPEDVNNPPAAPPTIFVTCPVCQYQCTSKNLYSHLTLAHPETKPARLVQRHFIEHLPPTGKKNKPTRRCVVCYRAGFRRKETVFWCPDCKTALCLVGCFKTYHTKLYFLTSNEGLKKKDNTNEIATKERMSRMRCCFSGCGLTKDQCSDLHFFRFPVNRPHILEQWLVNSGNEDIIFLSDEKLYKKRVCDTHFTDDCFTSGSRKTLKGDAVPTILNPEETEEVDSSDLKVPKVKKVYRRTN